MSVVACKVENDKIQVAADSILVCGYTQIKDKDAKIAEIGDLIIGTSGYAEEGSLFFIFCKTHKPNGKTENDILEFMSEFSDWKKKKTDNYKIENSYILVVENVAFDVDGYYVKQIINYAAIGAGRDYALAGLFLGHSAVESAEIACELSIYCEKPINSFIRNK